MDNVQITGGVIGFFIGIWLVRHVVRPATAWLDAKLLKVLGLKEDAHANRS